MTTFAFDICRCTGAYSVGGGGQIRLFFFGGGGYFAPPPIISPLSIKISPKFLRISLILPIFSYFYQFPPHFHRRQVNASGQVLALLPPDYTLQMYSKIICLISETDRIAARLNIVQKAGSCLLNPPYLCYGRPAHNTERFISYRKYILQITQPSQYRCTQLQFAVIFEAPMVCI